jgi:hypothetical protein
MALPLAGLLGFAGTLIPAITEILKQVIPDPNKRAEAQERITATILENEKAYVESAAQVIAAEAQGNWYVSAWRPTLMYLLMAEIVWLTVFCPILGLADPTIKAMAGVPAQFWNLLMIGMGGYIIGRSGEKVAASIWKK